MIKVLIVDDEFRVCQLICNLIDWGSLDMQIIDAGRRSQGWKQPAGTDTGEEAAAGDYGYPDARMHGIGAG